MPLHTDSIFIPSVLCGEFIMCLTQVQHIKRGHAMRVPVFVCVFFCILKYLCLVYSLFYFCIFLFHFHFFFVTLYQSVCYLGGREMFLFHSLPLPSVARSSFLACQPLLLGRSDAASYALIRYFLYFRSVFPNTVCTD